MRRTRNVTSGMRAFGRSRLRCCLTKAGSSRTLMQVRARTMPLTRKMRDSSKMKQQRL